MTRLSIIIPVYNTEVCKLQRCLESIKRIKETSYECLLVDDGSTDNVGFFLSEYANNTPQFKYIKKDNGGVSSARNLGIDHAQGKYVCFVDSDDAIEPKVYDTFLSNEYDSDIIFSDLLLVDGEKHAKWTVCNTDKLTYEKLIQRVVVDGKINGPICKYIKKDFICKHNIVFCEEMVTAEDLCFLLDMLIKKPIVDYIKAISYYYIRNKETSFNRLKKYPEKHFLNFEKAYLKEIECISVGNFSIEETEHLKQKSTDKYIKSVFNCSLDIIEAGMSLKNVEQNLVDSFIPIHIGITDKKSKIRGWLLLNKKWYLLRLIAILRRQYIKIKGLL